MLVVDGDADAGGGWCMMLMLVVDGVVLILVADGT